MTGCYLEDILADAIRVRHQTARSRITSFFEMVMTLSLCTPLDATIPVREGILVSGNTIINGGSIKILGGRLVNISQNHMIFPNPSGY